MSAPIVAFFNSKGGLGTTSIVYHLAWMCADLGARIIAADLDPQADLTAAFLDDDRLEELWPEGSYPDTIFGCVGYIVLQHSVRLDRPVKAYDRWMAQIPTVYQHAVLGEPGDGGVSVQTDPHCLALLKRYPSLMPMAQEARKPMFHLKPADGAMGGHLQAALSADRDFKQLAQKIAERTGVPVPSRIPIAAPA